MSEGEYESFEINDYDLENEFNPNRPRAKQSKNQQIYGSFTICKYNILQHPLAIIIINERKNKQFSVSILSGIWADDSDNDLPEEKPSKSARSRRRMKGRNVDSSGSSGNKKKLGSANYSEPVSFVSGGIQQSGKKKNDPTESNSGDDGECEDYEKFLLKSLREKQKNFR